MRAAAVHVAALGRLRGGDAPPAAAAAVSIATNTLAILCSSAFTDASMKSLVRHQRRGLSTAEKWTITALCSFAAYALIYAMCGFVPMGYVDGSKTLIDYLMFAASASKGL